MTALRRDIGELTRNQSLVYDTLSRAESPLSAYAILDSLRDRGFRAPLQVYRALDKLVELRIVHRLESLNAFVACRHPDCDTHETIAFAICESCGKVSEITDDTLEKKLTKLSQDIDFKSKKAIVELRGFCASCLPS